MKTNGIKRVLTITLTLLILAGCAGCTALETFPELPVATPAPASPAPTPAPTPEPTVEPVVEEPVKETEAIQIVLTSHVDSMYNEDNTTAYSCSYSTLGLTAEEAQKYPQLAAAFEQFNAQRQQTAAETMDNLRGSWEELKDYAGPSMELCSEVNLNVVRADSTAVCIASSYYDYLGGAHGWYGFGGYAFDTETGERITLRDVVTDMNAYTALVDQRLHEDYRELFEAVDGEIDYWSPYDDRDFNWVMDYDGVTIYFNPNEIGPYAAGVQSVKLYFDENEGLFDSKYTVPAENYVIPLVWGNSAAIDADGDGQRETLQFEAVANDEYSYSWNIKLGDRSLDINQYCYSQTEYVVRANGQYYLYIFGTTDNDYVLLVVVDLKTLQCVEEQPPALWLSTFDYVGTYTEDGVYHSEKSYVDFTNPQAFSLTRRFYTLSTVHGSRDYCVGPDGLPQAKEESFMIESRYILYSLQDIPCGEKTIPAGTYLTIVATDGEARVELQPVDPEIISDSGNEHYQLFLAESPVKYDSSKETYVLDYNQSDYPHTINGIDEEQLFTGIMYAG